MPGLPPLPRLYETPQHEIDEVARDLQWESAGCRVYFVVDSKDVIDFCFPLSAYDLAEPDLDIIAGEQTALDFVFCRRNPRPVLLPHYVDELAIHLEAIQNSASRAFEDLEMWNKIRFGLPAGGRSSAEAAGLGGDVFETLKKNIVRKLAVWLGIDSFGSNRFRQIIQHNLITAKEMCDENNDPDLSEIIQNYKPVHAAEISAFLESKIPLSVQGPKRSARVEACRRDAMAVDWLLYLNAKSRHFPVRANGETGAAAGVPRYLFLYMSSAHKTATLFEHLRTQPWYARALGENTAQDPTHHFHRNRRQILLVARTGWGNEDSSRRSANLDEINLISSMIAEAKSSMKSACDQCTLKGHAGDRNCAWLTICNAIQAVERKTSDVPDLGLMSKLTNYSKILKAKPRLTDQRTYLEELEEILRTGVVTDLALKRVLDQQSSAATQSLLIRRLSFSQANSASPALPEPLRILPALFPRVSPPYDQIRELVMQYCSLPKEQTDKLRGILLEAMNEFLRLDENVQAPASRDHELTRLLLHLAFGQKHGYVDVLERSRLLQQTVQEIKDDPYPFILCSAIASLLLERFLDTQNYVSEALAFRTDEPFLIHARGVNTFAWRRHPEQSVFCSREISTCIQDEWAALELAKNSRWAANQSSYFSGLILNNLTFMQSCTPDREFAKIFNLDQAVQVFQNLVETIPKIEWSALPHFFHTEAHLEYQLACANSSSRQDHLHKAKLAIQAAIGARPQEALYQNLRNQIEKAMRTPHKEPLQYLR